MNKNIKVFTILLFLCHFSALSAQIKTVKLSSPDHSISYTISIKNGYPEYAISNHGKVVINSSALGLIINSQQPGRGSSLQVLSRKKINEIYQTRGIHSRAINNCNDLLLNIKGESPYKIEVKVFNDGVAFRYIISNKVGATINADLTGFSIPSGSTVWSQDNIKTYEGGYQERKIEDITAGQLVGPPLTIKLSDHAGYAAITEAGLTDFAGMSLISQGNQLFKANLTGSTIKNGLIETPWRVILIGNMLNDLVNSNVISNVSKRPDKKLFPEGNDTEWIKPGKSVWSWLADENVSFQNMKRYSAMAGELGLEYNLVDEGWAKWKEGTKDKWVLMKELVDYSKDKGVKIWAWKAYPDRAGEPGIKDSTARRAFFKQCKAVGIVGLKIDFFDTESQEVIDFYQGALKDAAKYHLMLNFHGANKPTGESRTWPNEMSREAIMGLENTTGWAKHNTTLLFTRFLAGHADYTPLSFSTNVNGTTLTHQLATVAAFTSPFMCLAADPAALLKSKIKTMVKQIPVVWDETIILSQSKIGEVAIMARRKGKVWFLIVLNGETPKKLSVELKFLGQGNYHGNIFQDVAANENDTFNHQDDHFNKNSQIALSLSAGGGYIGRFYQ